MRLGKITVVTLVCLGFSVGEANEGWEVSDEDRDNEIVAYTRSVEGSRFKEFKVVTEVRAPMPEIVSTLKNVDGLKKWLYSVYKSELLRKKEGGGLTGMFVKKTPWPVRDRKLIFEANVTEVPESGEIIFEMRNLDRRDKVEDGLVRISGFSGKWVLSSVGDRRTKVVYQAHVEPGGSIPAWVMNRMITEGPMTSLRNLKELVRSST